MAKKNRRIKKEVDDDGDDMEVTLDKVIIAASKKGKNHEKK